MGRLTVLIAMVVLVVTACTGAGSQATPEPATAGPATATPAAKTPVPATATPTATATTPIAVSVAWDGKTCSYTGPTVVPEGSTMVWKLTNSPELDMWTWAGLLVGPVVDGTTWETILKDPGKVSVSPQWAILPGGVGTDEVRVLQPGDARMGKTMETRLTRNAYAVACAQSPQGTDKAFPAALIKVLKG